MQPRAETTRYFNKIEVRADMSRYRPADYQVNEIYECERCKHQTESNSFYTIDQCHCGGRLMLLGESYPADPNEWDEEQDRNGEWRRRY